MAYSRRRRAPRKSFRRLKPRTRTTLSKKIKKTIHRMAEHKQNEITLDSAVPYGSLVPVAAGANIFNLVTAIAQGSDNSNRIGDQVEGYVRITGMVRNTSATASVVVRMTAVTDIAQSNTISANTAPVQSNIYVNPTDLFSKELIKQRRYNIVKHKIWTLGPTVSGSASYQFSFNIPKRIMNWTAGTAAATDVAKGISYLLFESEVASVVEYTFNACTYFTDL